MMIRCIVIALCLVAAQGAENQQSTQQKKNERDEKEVIAPMSNQLKDVIATAESLAIEWVEYMQQNGYNVEKNTDFLGYYTNPEKVIFTVYSTPNSKHQFTLKDHDKLDENVFNPELPVHILIHGKSESEDIWRASELQYAYGIRGKRMNLITLDWSQYADGLYYPTVVYTVPQVANILSQLLQTLIQKHNVNPKQIRMTGFGIGAHIAGQAAKDIEPRIHRIIALDPAGLWYNLADKVGRLDREDADQVVSINTNLGPSNFGMDRLIGKVNFLPSGGRVQKPCEKLHRGRSACSHKLAIDLFLESVEVGEYGFVAKKCGDWMKFENKKCVFNETAIMGEAVSDTMEGTFFLKINERPPYNKGINGAYLYDSQKSE